MNNQTHEAQALVTLSGISKMFDGKEIIANFDLTINHEEFLTLLGPSGCGKTTILRLIAGLEDADSGTSRHYFNARSKSSRQYCLSELCVVPHMSVFENVAFGLRMQKTPVAEIRSQVHEALIMVQLDQFADRRLHQLSGGQQRVAIARAVVNQPKMLLDKSLSALDYKQCRQMHNELKVLQRRLRITFVFVTHAQEEAH